jgi:hypothetical protein
LQPLGFRAGQPSYATVLPVKLPTPQGNGAGFEPAFCRWLVFYHVRLPRQPSDKRAAHLHGSRNIERLEAAISKGFNPFHGGINCATRAFVEDLAAPEGIDVEDLHVTKVTSIGGLGNRLAIFYVLYMTDYNVHHLQALRQGVEMLLNAHRAKCCPHTGIYELNASRLEGLIDALKQWCACTFLANPVVEADEMCKGRVWLRLRISGTLYTDVALNILP